MMAKVMLMMMAVGVMKMGVHADGKVALNTSDFKVLCDLSDSLIGLWNTVNAETSLVNIDVHGEDELGKIIDKIFFGEKGYGSYRGIMFLPEQFKSASPERYEACGSISSSTGMPSASESLASALLCLCTPIKEEEKTLCELQVNGEGTWPDRGKRESVQNLLEHVWGEFSNGGVGEHCGKGDESTTVKEAMKKLKDTVTELEKAINKTGMLDKDKAKCEETTPCADVTKDPAWLKKLGEIEKIAEQTIALLEEKKLESQRELEKHTSPDPAETIPQDAPAVPSPPVAAPAPASSSPKVGEETKKKEPVKAPPPKPEPASVFKPENEVMNTPQIPTDDLHPPPENETSRFFLTRPKWPHLAVLLF